MGPIKVDQSHQVMAVLATNVDWSGIDFQVSGLQDLVVRDPKGAGKQFEAFLRNGCRLLVENLFRETGELSIAIPALPRPTLEELQGKFSWIKSIERDNSPVEAVTLKLGTVLRPEETKSINGTEYERRLMPKLDVVLSYQQAMWLVEHQDEFPEFMALLGKVYIDFPGMIVVHDDGRRPCAFLGSDGERWSLLWRWFDGDFSARGRVAVSGK